MDLTSFNRVKNRYGIAAGGNHVDRDTARLYQLISSVSRKFEQYCKRFFEKVSRTEFFDPLLGQRVFRTNAYPISSITSIHHDGSGQYTGDETLIASTDYIIGTDSRTVVLDVVPEYTNNAGTSRATDIRPKSLRIIHTSGLATSPSQTVLAISSAGSFDIGSRAYQRAQDHTDLPKTAEGIVHVASASSITIETLYGVFDTSRTLYTTGGSVSANVDSITSQSLAEAYPDLVEACEMQVYYEYQGHDNWGNAGTDREGSSKRPDITDDYDFLPEVRSKLERFRNKIVEEFAV